MSETLLNEIRAARPEAPAALRERVRSLSVREPVREPWLNRIRFILLTQNLGWRRLVLVAPAAIAVALVAGGVIGLTRGDVGGRESELAAVAPPAAGATSDSLRVAPALPESAQAVPSAKDATRSAGGGAVTPVPGQLQRFEAELSLRVDDVDELSEATKRAQQIARDHGGSVASLQYDAPSHGVGTAQITLRIPTAKVQGALTELSQLGTILGQRYGIDDLQQQADSLQTEIEQTQRRIAQLLTQLENPNLSDADRVVLQSRLTSNRQKLTGLRETLRSTRAEAATSTVYLTLTTEEIQAAPVGGGRLEGIKDVLAWEAIALLYAVVIVGPFVILGVLVWLLLKLLRRRETARLLEQN